MSLKYRAYSPFVRSGLAYDAEFDPVLRGIDIKPGATGTLFLIDVQNTAVSYPITVTDVPFRLVLQIQKIVGNGSGSIGDGVTGTNIALANMVGLL
jgi:hypothetical protein